MPIAELLVTLIPHSQISFEPGREEGAGDGLSEHSSGKEELGGLEGAVGDW